MIQLDEGNSTLETCEPGKQGSLSKKMRAISLTMRLKMGRKCAKNLSDDMVSDSRRPVAVAVLSGVLML